MLIYFNYIPNIPVKYVKYAIQSTKYASCKWHKIRQSLKRIFFGIPIKLAIMNLYCIPCELAKLHHMLATPIERYVNKIQLKISTRNVQSAYILANPLFH